MSDNTTHKAHLDKNIAIKPFNKAISLSSYEIDGKKISKLKPGYVADVIALKNNTLVQIDNLQTIDFVMKSGSIYKSLMGRC